MRMYLSANLLYHYIHPYKNVTTIILYFSDLDIYVFILHITTLAFL